MIIIFHTTVHPSKFLLYSFSNKVFDLFSSLEFWLYDHSIWKTENPCRIPSFTSERFFQRRSTILRFSDNSKDVYSLLKVHLICLLVTCCTQGKWNLMLAPLIWPFSTLLGHVKLNSMEPQSWAKYRREPKEGRQLASFAFSYFSLGSSLTVVIHSLK